MALRLEFNLSGSWRSGPDLPEDLDEQDQAKHKAVELANLCGCKKMRITYAFGEATRVVAEYWNTERGWH